MKIKLDDIVILRQFLRREIDAEQLRLLAEDLKLNGQIQPIAVKPAPYGKWELVAGRRRYEAHKLLGWTEIDAHEIEDRGISEIPALAENVKRSNLTPLEEADIVAWMHSPPPGGNMSIAVIAEQTGHGTSWVQDRLAVGQLDQALKDAIHKKQLSISAAFMMARITDIEYRDYLIHIAATNGASTNQCEAWWLDWQARAKLSGQETLGNNIPQPFLPPATPRSHCFFCASEVENSEIVLLRACRPCHQEMHEEKKRLDLEAIRTAKESERESENEPPTPQEN